MRRFLVQKWGFDPFTVVWCRGVKCTDCRLRFDCWTRNEDYVLLRKESALNGYEFKGQLLPLFIEGISDGARLGMSIETLVEYVIAGEKAQEVPSGQWNRGWVYQAGCRCPEKVTPRHILDSNFNPELKAVLFPCKECKESFICKATNRYKYRSK